MKWIQKYWLLLAVLLISTPFWLTLAGDAQVHLAIAEQFAAGQPFRYNPGGELVVASTSPFWTMLLTLFFWLAGSAAPLLLKLTGVGVWLGTAVLLQRIAQKHFPFANSQWSMVNGQLSTATPSSFILHPSSLPKRSSHERRNHQRRRIQRHLQR